MTVGSKKADLQEEALAIFFNFTNTLYISTLRPLRKDNEVADYLSRLVDYDNWSLDRTTFMELDRAWDPHTVD